MSNDHFTWLAVEKNVATNLPANAPVAQSLPLPSRNLKMFDF